MPITDLTPAEAMVLLDPQRNQGREAFKISLMWLLAQHHLTATAIPGRWFGKPSTQLSRGPRAGARLPPDLQAVMSTVAAAGTGLMNDVVKEARTRFGADLGRFLNDFVHPSLLGRGLVRSFEEKSRVLFIPITRARHERTPAGEALARQIETLFEDARRIPGYLDRSPAQAAALAVSLGGLILLLPELRPHLDRIAAVTRRSTDPTDSGYSPSDTSSSSSSASSPQGIPSENDRENFHFDFGLVDQGLQDFDGFASSLDTLDSSFDSSADSGGGDGGGDGGGGGGGD